MLRNYMKTAYRSLIRSPLYTIISIVGLSIGIACCLLIFLFVQDELSFDKFHANADHLYRMIQIEGVTGELASGTPSTSALLQGELKASFPEVQRATRVFGGDMAVTRDDKSFTQMVVTVDPDFFSMFSFDILQGNPTSPLKSPDEVLITPEMARKFFGDDDPLHKRLSIQLSDQRRDFEVGGIIEKAPENSSIQYDVLISSGTLKYNVPERVLQTWDLILFSTYVQIAPGVDLDALKQRISEHISRISGNEDPEQPLRFDFQPIASIHLNPTLEGEMVPSSNPVYSIILSAIAFAVLVIACINFMTLAIGRSSTRAREVGLRKVLGAQRSKLMVQFWGEALLMTGGALVLGVILTEALLPAFNGIAEKQLSLGLILNWKLLLLIGALTLLTATMAGIYPALLLSKRSPIAAMKGDIIRGSGNRLVKGMVILQFAISVFLIAGTLIMSSQLDYVESAHLGYNKEHVVLISSGTEGQEAARLLERFRTRLRGNASVVDVSGYTYQFGRPWLYLRPEDDGMTVLIGEDITGTGYADSHEDKKVYFYMNWVDPHYIPTFGMKVLEGRNFSDDYPSDTNDAIIINQAAAEIFGLQDPVGKKLPKGFRSATIVGLVEDFHFYPLQRSIDPLVLHMVRHDDMSSIRNMAVRISGHDVPSTISMLETTWNEVSNGMPFDYSFLDDAVSAQYAAEQRWKHIIEYSSVLSILITCLGLFGLTSLSVAKRTREVGIRKTFGASTPRLVVMFMKLFAILALIGNIIAWPVIYIVMSRWLEHFAYRTDMSVTPFLITGSIVVVVAMLTVSYQATRAALANPVDSLRHE